MRAQVAEHESLKLSLIPFRVAPREGACVSPDTSAGDSRVIQQWTVSSFRLLLIVALAWHSGGCLLPEVSSQEGWHVGSTNSVVSDDSPTTQPQKFAPIQPDVTQDAGSVRSAAVAMPETGSAGLSGARESAGAEAETSDAGIVQARMPAICESEAYRCDGATLLRCTNQPANYVQVATCGSAALCDAVAGRCVPPTCESGSALCKSNALYKCDVSGTGYTETPCGTGYCNQEKSRCDLCKASSMRCDGDMLFVCNANGDGSSSSACSVERPYDADCRIPFCNASSNECRSRNVADGASCNTRSTTPGRCQNGSCQL